MQWSGWSEFWHMGGYGYYVWMSFGATLAGVALELASLRARRSRAIRQIEAERDLEATD
jgi:heme exporter protein D